LIPTANVTYSLGNATNAWSNLYLSGSTIYLGSLQLKATNATTFAVYQADGSTLANVSASGLSVTSITDGTSAYQFAGINGNAIITAGGANTLTVTSTGIVTSGTASVSGNITGGNISATTHTGTTVSVTGTVTAASVVGGVITGSSVSVTGAVTAASIVGGVSTATSYSASGTVTGASVVGGVITGSSVSVTGAVTAASIVGGVSTATSYSASGTVTGASVVGGSVTVSGNTIVAAGPTLTIDPNGAGGTDGNVIIAGNLTVQGTTTTINSNTVTTNDLFINVANNASTSSAANGGGLKVGPVGSEYATLTYNSGTTAWNTSISLSVTGTVTAASTVGGVITGSSASVTGTVTGASVVGGVMSGTSLTVTTGTITGGNIVNGNGNGVGNIGSSTTYFNTVFAKATSAQYADLAEKYTADAEYAPGTVVVFGGLAEVTVNATDADRKVAGVITTNPSYIMNSGLEAEHVATVALTGRVPCFVIGPVKKGDLMVAAGLGRARAEADPKVGAVIGKALEDFEGTEGTIEVVVGRF
jgi:filamentous hemagglutinin